MDRCSLPVDGSRRLPQVLIRMRRSHARYVSQFAVSTLFKGMQTKTSSGRRPSCYIATVRLWATRTVANRSFTGRLTVVGLRQVLGQGTTLPRERFSLWSSRGEPGLGEPTTYSSPLRSASLHRLSGSSAEFSCRTLHKYKVDRVPARKGCFNAITQGPTSFFAT